MIHPLPLSHDFGWNEIASRYIDLTTGRFVSRALVAQELEKVITASGNNIQAVSQSLIDGSISLPEWQLAMEREIKLIHTASGAVARGGWSQMSQTDWGFVGAQIKKQYQWLDNFAVDIARGKQKLDGRLLNRARLYAQSGRGTFEEMRRRMARNKGMTRERRLLAPAEHCRGCIEQAAMSWQSIGTLDPIGAEECRTNCVCRFEYQQLSV